jgi:Cu(I)/Ag(I) efflux system membrane fusion protein
MEMAGAPPAPAGQEGAVLARPHGSGQRFDKPGKSPFMDMHVVPVYEDERRPVAGGVDSRMQQSLGMRTAE